MILEQLYKDIDINLYGIKHNKETECVIHSKDGRWIVESKQYCKEDGASCVAYVSCFAILVIMSSKSYVKVLTNLDDTGVLICGI